MRITDDVDLPETLVNAAVAGDLVLFVGAGASRNAPSNLPLFSGLAGQLAQIAGVTFDDSMGPDSFIGQLCDSEPAIREHIRTIIGDPNSHPNDTHRAIVRLSNATGELRIVSTNYDEHLSAAASELSIEVGDVYSGPAVPLGQEFKGLVYLHGRVSRPAAELVISDKDFGRAYLIDGWARRFVTNLFLNRTVLFIGYSHDDAVMKYLARGLPPATKRFALTSESGDTKWRDLGITPIAYPGTNDHAALTAALNRWAHSLEMGQLDHRARIFEIVSGSPPMVPVEADYLADAIKLPAGVRAFSERARGEEWLIWAERHPLFLSLFQAGHQVTDQSRVLAYWFASNYVLDPDMNNLALATIARHGPIVCSELLSALTRATYRLQPDSPELARKWTVIVAAALQTHEGSSNELRNLLHHKTIQGAPALILLRRSLHPRLRLSMERPWYSNDSGTPDQVKMSIKWSSSDSDLERLWEAVRIDLPTNATSVLQIFEQALRDAYELLMVCTGSESWDSWSFGRSAIEPHEQDMSRDHESVVIDALRDTSVLLMNSGHHPINRWLSSKFALFRRLALHLIVENSSMDPHEKLELLLSGTSLHDYDSHHEVFRLLAHLAPILDHQDRSRLLASILLGPTQIDVQSNPAKDLHERWIFTRIEWLSRFAIDWAELNRELEIIRENHPKFSAWEHADFTRWMETGSLVEESTPFTIEEFIETFDNGESSDASSSAVTFLVNQKYHDHTLDGPTWLGACSLVRKAVNERPDLGLSLLTASISDVTPSQEIEFRAAIIRGIADARPDGPALEQAIKGLETLASQEELAHPISDLCLSSVDEKTSYSETTLTYLDELAKKVWTFHAPDFEKPDYDDWYTMGLNTWPGVLAQYCLGRIRVRWTAHAEDWQGLTEFEKDTITELIDARISATSASLAIIAGDTYFLFVADPDFTKNSIFPLFESPDSERVLQAWMSYLHHPRVNDAMLSTGFWELLRSVNNQIAKFDSAYYLEHQYWDLMASICIRATGNTVDPPSYLERLKDPSHIRNFIRALTRVFQIIDESQVEHAWTSWISDTATTRLSRPQSTLSEEERCSWGNMALRLPNIVSRAAIKVSDIAPGPLNDETIFGHLPSEVLEKHPDDIARVITRRLKATHTTNWHIAHELESVVNMLKGAGVDQGLLTALVEAALGVGVYDAPSWIDQSSS